MYDLKLKVEVRGINILVKIGIYLCDLLCALLGVFDSMYPI